VELALTAVMLLLCFPLLLALFLHSPTADRLGGGLAGDESVMSRISVYEALHFLSPNEFLFGATYGHAQAILLDGVKLQRVESPIVSSVLMFGAVNTVVLGFGYVLFFTGLFRSSGRFAKIAIVAFVIASLSNNTLTTKSPALLFIVVLAAATDEYVRPGSRVGRRNRPNAVNYQTRAVCL
jgi:polysaccharide biosynthesis protein VpsF